jgi:TPR repeat protein
MKAVLFMILLLSIPSGFAETENSIDALETCAMNLKKTSMDIRDLESKAKQNTQDGAYYKALLSGAYYRGIYVDINLELALDYAKTAIDKDVSGLALYEFAVLSDDDEKSASYYARALPLLEKSAKQGDAYAQYKLAYLLSNGVVTKNKDEAEADRLFKLSAENGYYQALWTYGRYLEEKGDIPSAHKFFCQGAQQGIIDSMLEYSHFMSRLYEKTEIPEYYETAHKWFKKYIEADSNSGRLLDVALDYQNGRIFEVNYEAAAKIFRKIIEMNHDKTTVAKSKYYLGMLMHYELLPSNSKDKGRSFFKQAAEEGDERAKNFLELLRH